MENLRGKINSSAIIDTVHGATFDTVTRASINSTVPLLAPVERFFPFPTVPLSTPFIEYAILIGFFLMAFYGGKERLGAGGRDNVSEGVTRNEQRTYT